MIRSSAEKTHLQGHLIFPFSDDDHLLISFCVRMHIIMQWTLIFEFLANDDRFLSVNVGFPQGKILTVIIDHQTGRP